MNNKDLYLKAKAMENLLISRATGGNVEEKDYQELRSALMNSVAKGLIPDFVVFNRSVDQFWQFIKRKYAHYDERRDFI